jgi:hypothetical protein
MGQSYKNKNETLVSYGINLRLLEHVFQLSVSFQPEKNTGRKKGKKLCSMSLQNH